MEEHINVGRFFELATTKKIYVNRLNLHEIKSKILESSTGEFELIGPMLIGEMEQRTLIRFKKFDVFETYNNAIGVDYVSEDDIFSGWLYK